MMRGADTRARRKERHIIFKWFVGTKTAGIGLTALIWFAGGRAFAESVVLSAPAPLAGVVFLGVCMLIGLPFIILVLGGMLMGFRQASKVRADAA